jgi:hypothetical protein
MSRHTLYAWKKKFDTEGPAGLLDKPRGGPQQGQIGDMLIVSATVPCCHCHLHLLKPGCHEIRGNSHRQIVKPGLAAWVCQNWYGTRKTPRLSQVGRSPGALAAT